MALEIQLAIVKKLRELYPTIKSTYYINTKICDLYRNSVLKTRLFL